MAFRIFYAWQSDRPNKLCRGLIRGALDEAKKQLEEDLDIQDAVRGEIVVDQDTQDVPGSPPVAETIFDKIRECNAFIADLTPTHIGPDGKPAPNPHILIEYGYALHTLGDQRILGVFNEAFGRPEDLPFDLVHRRWPIRYRAHEDDVSETRRSERQRLARELANAIRSIIRSVSESKPLGLTGSVGVAGGSPAVLPTTHQQVASAAETTLSATEQFPWNVGLIRSSSDVAIEFREAPTIFLNLRSHKGGRQLENTKIQRIASNSLHPLASRRADGWFAARSRNGAAVYTSFGTDQPVALTASMLARDSSLHGVDRYHLRVDSSENWVDPYLPMTAVKEILVDGLANFMSVAEHQIILETPLDVAVGLEGIEGYKIAISRPMYFKELVGPILVERIDDRFRIDSYASDPFDFLLPFFKKIYDEAGYKRPDVRTVGMSQR